MSKTVLIVGLGDIGEHVLEILVQTPGISKIIGADINEDASLRRIYSARAGGAHLGSYPKIEFIKMNVNDIDQTANQLQNLNPDVILSSVTRMTWWMAGAEVPSELFRELDEAGFGPWLPLHLTLVYKFAQALKRSGIRAPLINASYPDVVNSVLGKVGLAPVVGLGNFDLMIPEIQKVVADELGVPMRNVQVYLVADHFIVHYLGAYASTGGAPYYLRIFAYNEDVTEKFNLEELLVKANKYMPKGVNDHFIVAASAVKNILAILDDSEILTHAPGPAGLPGGYPIRLGRETVEVILPENITLDEAIKINEQAQIFDGVERIENDGTVVFTEKSAEIMREMLGYDCKILKLDECEKRAEELIKLYRAFTEKFRS